MNMIRVTPTHAEQDAPENPEKKWKDKVEEMYFRLAFPAATLGEIVGDAVRSFASYEVDEHAGDYNGDYGEADAGKWPTKT